MVGAVAGGGGCDAVAAPPSRGFRWGRCGCTTCRCAGGMRWLTVIVGEWLARIGDFELAEPYSPDASMFVGGGLMLPCLPLVWDAPHSLRDAAWRP